MNVMSLFDGMSCGRLALERAGLPVTIYKASEIDKYAIKIAQKNYPDTIQIGDVENISDGRSYPQMDLLLGGSPCQGFSFAGRGLNFDDPRSKLFWRYVWFLKENKPKYFLLENVRMNQKSQDVISRALGVEPVAINSNLVSAQNRYRLYWTNIPFEMPKDKGIKLKDILENGCVDRDKPHCLDANYFKGGNLKQYFEKHRRQLVFSNNGLCHVGDADLKGHGYNRRVYHPEGKAPSLCASSGGNLGPKTITSETTWRKLTPIECERLQTVPDNYTEGVSNTQRYKMLGNGWTVDVIAHILRGIT